MKKVWIAWEDDASIRSRVLAQELKASFFTFTKFEGKKFLFPLRYAVAVAQTLSLILRRRPHLLIVQNPSIFLAFVAALTKPLMRYKLVVDYHTLYITPKVLMKFILAKVNNFALNASDLIIVTNESYRMKITRHVKTRTIILPDKIPDLSVNGTLASLSGKFNILYICSFSKDEPWREVVAAAKLISPDTWIYISGKSDSITQKLKVPPNVVFTGYMPTATYQSLLKAVDAIIVLTKADDCLVCGGYEAVAAEKPLILSDRKVLREYFDQGAFYTNNNAHDIAEAIEIAIRDRKRLGQEIRDLKVARKRDWQEKWNTFAELASEL